MKSKLIILMILLNSTLMFAQNQAEISGQIKDSQTKQAIEFCSISVYNTKDSLISGSITNNITFSFPGGHIILFLVA